MARKPNKKNYTYAVGRRKEAVATVRLFQEKGETTVNNQPINKYFPDKIANTYYQLPFKITDNLDKFWAKITVVGGGRQGQLQAVTLALARALEKFNPPIYRSILKKAGLLTVDARTRERRKAGLGGKARRKKQSPKR
jgi:small subunit ribosomal protein S9